VFLARALQKLTRALTILFYIALGGFVLYFPLGYLGEVIIYPMWKWAPLLNRMAIKNSMPILFVLAIVCALLQMIASSLSRWTGGGRHSANDAAESARTESHA
jgi:p-aminobenzoyl-glutamate transporter AbgT